MRAAFLWTLTSLKPDNPGMQTRKSFVAAVFVPVLIGCMGLFHVTQQPRFAAFHNVDVLQLIASGMCFGVALFALLTMLRSKRAS
jgi:hypothetical protein